MPGEYTKFDGGSRFFFRNVNLHVSKQYAAHSHMIVKPCPLRGGLGACSPPRKFEKK